MKKRTPAWDDLHTFAVLARTGSYSGAARELGLTHATVGRRLQRLEERVGVSLLVRRDGSFDLTDAGLQALQVAEEMERAASRLKHALETEPPGLSGRIRITATETLATYFFLPRLDEFHQQHPGIVLEWILDDRTLSLARRKADIALRLARPTEEGLVTKCLGSMGYGLYARCDSATRTPWKQWRTESIPLCRYIEAAIELPENRWVAKHMPLARHSFNANNIAALYQAVRGGWGAALLPNFLVAHDTDLTLLSEPVELEREIWITFPQEYRVIPRYRETINWLARLTNENSTLLKAGLV